MPRHRVSLTLDAEVVRRVDALVDGILIKSRSHAVERILSEKLGADRTAVILCGGSTESLRVAGSREYKPLEKIGSATLIEDQLAKIAAAGFKRVVIAGNAAAVNAVNERVGDGSSTRLNLRVEYAREARPQGDGRTLETAREFLSSSFLVVPCDYYFTFDLKREFEFHLRSGAAATLAVYAGSEFAESAKCFAKMDGDRITELCSSREATAMVATLVFAASPEIFDYFPKAAAGGAGECVLRRDVLPRLAAEGKLAGYLSPGTRVNLHSASDLAAVRRLAKK